jgi:hypothetical protein
MTMKKKPVYRYGTPRGIETKGNANGAITSYIMDPVELAKYRAMPKPDYELEKKLNRSMMGGNDIA